MIPPSLPGIDLNEAEQLQLFEQFTPYFREAEFPRTKQEGRRYYTDCGWYPEGDAIFLYGMMRHFKPSRIIEVGSGFSSCVMLDTNERHFQNRIQCTFIEPNPERFLSAIHPDDKKRVDLVAKDVREVEPEYFKCLSKGDILFIDSSHVSKVHSDVNWLIFEVLPALQSGVLIHIHDITYPFKYPEKWIYDGVSWNEGYLLCAFLQYNSAFKICFFNSHFYGLHRDKVMAQIPRIFDTGRGGSIWLRKI